MITMRNFNLFIRSATVSIFLTSNARTEPEKNIDAAPDYKIIKLVGMRAEFGLSIKHHASKVFRENNPSKFQLENSDNEPAVASSELYGVIILNKAQDAEPTLQQKRAVISLIKAEKNIKIWYIIRSHTNSYEILAVCGIPTSAEALNENESKK